MGRQFGIGGNYRDGSTLSHLSEDRHENSKRWEGHCDLIFPVDNPELRRVTSTDDRGEKPAAFPGHPRLVFRRKRGRNTLVVVHRQLIPGDHLTVTSFLLRRCGAGHPGHQVGHALEHRRQGPCSLWWRLDSKTALGGALNLDGGEQLLDHWCRSLGG